MRTINRTKIDSTTYRHRTPPVVYQHPPTACTPTRRKPSTPVPSPAPHSTYCWDTNMTYFKPTPTLPTQQHYLLDTNTQDYLLYTNTTYSTLNTNARHQQQHHLLPINTAYCKSTPSVHQRHLMYSNTNITCRASTPALPTHQYY